MPCLDAKFASCNYHFELMVTIQGEANEMKELLLERLLDERKHGNNHDKMHLPRDSSPP